MTWTLIVFLVGWGAVNVPFQSSEACYQAGVQIEKRFIGPKSALWWCVNDKTGELLP